MLVAQSVRLSDYMHVNDLAIASNHSSDAVWGELFYLVMCTLMTHGPVGSYSSLAPYAKYFLSYCH